MLLTNKQIDNAYKQGLTAGKIELLDQIVAGLVELNRKKKISKKELIISLKPYVDDNFELLRIIARIEIERRKLDAKI